MLILESDIIEAMDLQPWEPNLFQLGGFFPMSVVTLLLIALLFAAWKVPDRVKEIGLITLALGFLWIATGLIKDGKIMQEDNVDISPNLVLWGLKCCLIPFAYSIIVYIVSLVIRIIRKIPDCSVHCWVKGIGLLALGLGLLWIPIGLIRTADLIQVTGDASLSAIGLGVKSSLIPFTVSLIVYIISLVVRIVIKPGK
jgi:hypothetical protein